MDTRRNLVTQKTLLKNSSYTTRNMNEEELSTMAQSCLNCAIPVEACFRRIGVGSRDDEDNDEATKCTNVVSVRGQSVHFKSNKATSRTPITDDSLNVTIPELLSYLFNIDDISSTWGQDLILCGDCGDILAELYLLHKDFDKLTSSISILAIELGNKKKWSESQQMPDKDHVENGNDYNETICKVEIKEEVEEEVEGHNLDQLQMDFDDNDSNSNYDFPNPMSPPDYEPLPNTSYQDKPKKPHAKKFIAESSSKAQENNTGDTVPCLICSKRVTKGKRMKQHLKWHQSNGLIFECTICGMISDLKPTIIDHIKTHRGLDEQKSDDVYTCYSCGKIYLNQEIFLEHHSTHPLQPIRTVSHRCRYNPFCLACTTIGGNSSSGSKFLGQQIRIPCEEHKLRVCEICGKFCEDSGRKITHSLTHHSLEQRKLEVVKLDKPFLCQLCGASFPHEKGLTHHYNNNHSKEEFKCPTCGHTCQTKAGLRNHIKNHTQGARLKCPGCPQIFEFKYMLVEHRMYCEGLEHERIVQCTECLKRFKNGHGVFRHIVEVHKFSKEEARKMTKVQLDKTGTILTGEKSILKSRRLDT